MDSHNRKKGALCLIAASFFFAGMSVFVRLAGELPTFEKAFFRNLISLMVAIMVMRQEGISIKVERSAHKYVAMRAIFGTIGLLCNFYAIDRINLADASMLNKMSPFYAVIFSALLLKEKVVLRQILVMIFAFMGSLLIVKPNPSELHIGPALVAAIGGIASGAAYTCMRGATTRGVNKSRVIFAFSAFSTLVIIPFMILNFTMPNLKQLVFMLLSGCCSAGGQFAITAGYNYAPAKDISVFDNTQVLFAALFGTLFFGQFPDILSIIGYAVIICLGIYSFLYDRRALS